MDIIDLKVALHAETDKAYRVSLDGDQKEAVWIPKSQVEFFENNGGEVVEISIPEWLAYEKKLI